LPKPPPQLLSLLAYARALGDPATYDPRTNVGLWLGFLLAIPIPVMAITLSAPPVVALATFLAPLGWGVIVGAASQVGMNRENMIQRLRREALQDAKVREETYDKLRSEASWERLQREDLARVATVADAELALAKVVHDGLISKDIDSDDLVVTIRHTPYAYVGGDYIQTTRPRPDVLYLCIADVAGHGVAAALVVSRLHALVVRLTQEDAGPKAILAALDRAALELLAHTSLFVTGAVFRIDLASREIEYGTAGHPAQFLLRSEAAVEELSTPNAALGLQLSVARTGQVTRVVGYDPGDTLLLFTDGLFEGKETGGRRETWGEDALMSYFARVGQGEPGMVADRILEAAQAHRGLGVADDDVSLIVVRLGRREAGHAAASA
jgi:serine phosphatase RsbU (regulator of sigma subunit)